MRPVLFSFVLTYVIFRKLTQEENEALMLGEGEMSQCLVAMARLQPFGSGDGEGGPPQEPSDSEFVARVSLDGRFSYMDHRYCIHSWYMGTVCTVGIWVLCVQLVYGYCVYSWYMSTACTVGIWVLCIQLVYGYCVYSWYMGTVCTVGI